MERRRAPRIAVGYRAEVLCNGKSCECVIENLSSTGANVIALVSGAMMDIKPKDLVELRFQPHSGETLSLQCRVAWANRTRPHNLTNRIGLEIVDPSWEQCPYIV